MKVVQLILKFSERCNLNCSYCYYFNGLDQSFKTKPKYLKEEVLSQVIIFLKQAIVELKLDQISISFHGGEPMLIGKKRFAAYCERLIAVLSSAIPSFELSMQTNGVLIDEEWIELFRKYNIRLGISLDGNKKAHDRYRVDHKGRGSYDQLEKAIRLLQAKEYEFGVLTVFDPSTNPFEILDHYINTLQIKHRRLAHLRN